MWLISRFSIGRRQASSIPPQSGTVLRLLRLTDDPTGRQAAMFT